MLQLLNISRREKNVLIIIGVLLFLFALYTYIFEPLMGRISFLNKEIETKELKLKKNQKILRREELVANESQKYEQFLKQSASDEQEMASILSEIEAIAKTSSIRINDMKPRKVKGIDFYNSFAVEIDGEGGLKEIIKFIYSLQSAPHLLKAEKLRLERQVAASANLKAYLLVTKILIP